MSRPLRGQRYAEGADPAMVALIEKLRDCRSFEVVREAYERFVPQMSPTEQALLACNDRFFLLVVLCNRRDMSHPWIFQRCREVEAAPDGHLDLWARYHGKSSIITFAGVIQEVLIDPEIRVGIFSNTKEMARHFVDQIKSELEGNQKLIALFADVLWQSPAERKGGSVSWSKADGITVKRAGNPKEATVEGHGLIDALPTGKHFPLLVYDDPINEGNVTNPDQVKKATEQMQLSFSLGDAQGTRKWFIGTRYHFSDTYAFVLEHQIATPRIYPATDTGTLNGNPVFLTKGGWEQVKREQRGVVAAQFLQNPLAGEENTFTTRWLRSYWTRPRLCNIYITIDPSMGRGKTSDRTAIAVIGVDGNERDRLRKYLLDGYCHRMPLSERYERVRDLHKRWSKMPGVQMVKVGLERYGMQSDDEYFRERMRIENDWFANQSFSIRMRSRKYSSVWMTLEADLDHLHARHLRPAFVQVAHAFVSFRERHAVAVTIQAVACAADRARCRSTPITAVGGLPAAHRRVDSDVDVAQARGTSGVGARPKWVKVFSSARRGNYRSNLHHDPTALLALHVLPSPFVRNTGLPFSVPVSVAG